MIFNIFNKRQIQLDELGWKWNFSYLQENPPVRFFVICGNQGINFYSSE